MQDTTNKLHKILSVCIIGKPNAGKSTLLNRLIGMKISIVTPKVQTTRSIITGVVTLDDTQFIFYDTPGIFEAKKKLEKAMVRCAWSSLSGADIVAIIIDSTKKIDDTTRQILTRLKELNKEIIFLLNKIDLKAKSLTGNISFISDNFSNPLMLNISALEGTGVENLLNFLKSKAKEGEWFYGSDDITNLPMRFLASEITREQLFLNLQQELPYNLTVENESWQTQKDGSVKINQVIIVSRDSYKNIIIGHGGAKIKEIGSKARKNIEALLELKVHLFLFVKVRKSWEDNPEIYKYMGLKI